MNDTSSNPTRIVRPLLRTRQNREFTSEPIDRARLDAIVDVARWSGSATNRQPWRFILVQDRATLDALGSASERPARPLHSAPAAVVIVMPGEQGREIGEAYDEGRAAERMLIAAGMLGLQAGIAWIHPDGRAKARELLGVPEGRVIRTTIAIGHPTEQARQPKAEPGKARLPREQVVFEERWRA